MKSHEFFIKIRKNEFEPIYIFKGEEEYIKDLAIKELSERCVTGLSELNIMSLNGNDVDLSEINKHCQQLPMMSDKRMVIVRDFKPFIEGRYTLIAEEIKAFLKDFPPHCMLIFLLRGAVDMTAAYRSFSRKVSIITFDLKSGSDAIKWAQNFAGKHKLNIDYGALHYLVNYIKPGLSNLENEIIKLQNAVDKDSPVKRELITRLCIPSVDYKLYAIVNHIIQGRASSGLSGAKVLEAEGWPVPVLISIIHKQIHAILRADDVRAAGMDIKKAAKILGVRDFVITGAMGRRGKLKSSHLRQMVHMCDKVSYNIRTGEVKSEFALKYLIIELARIAL